MPRRNFFVLVAVAFALLALSTRAHAADDQEKVLYRFCSLANCTDGDQPTGALAFDSNGNLFGTTQYGGSDAATGVVYELSPAADGTWTDTVLYTFDPALTPGGYLVLDTAGNVYGTAAPLTGTGGAPCTISQGCGIAFELQHGSGGQWQFKVLHTFLPNGVDGTVPNAGLVWDAAGNLYGSTSSGGLKDCGSGRRKNRCGTIFELSPNSDGTWTETIIEKFNVINGAYPNGPLAIDANGNLYGTTEAGGGATGAGVVFELLPQGSGKWQKKTIYTFNANGGLAVPIGNLVLDTQGNLYGATFIGEAGYGSGSVFELQNDGSGHWTRHVLHNFVSGVYPLFAEGLTQDNNGNLYGTTDLGGAYGDGSVFELALNAENQWIKKDLYSFNATKYLRLGDFPFGPVIFGPDGNLYGTASSGGIGNDDCFNATFGCGVVFQLTP